MILTVDPKFTFDEKTHRYFYDGQRIPNVTSLLQDYGLIDLSMVPPDRLEYKRQLGIAVHYATHLLDEHNLDESSLNPVIVPYVDAYRKFLEISGFEPKHSELKLFSKRWRFAGTLDRQGLLEYKGKLLEVIIDLKCTWEMYPSTGPQSAAYQILFEENFGTKIKGRFGLQLKENGNYELYLYADPSDAQTFLSCLRLHHWRQEKGLIK